MQKRVFKMGKDVIRGTGLEHNKIEMGNRQYSRHGPFGSSIIEY